MPDKFDEFALEISKLAEYYEKPQGKWSIEIYWNNLKFYTIDELREAVGIHIRTDGAGRFMPKISELLPLLKMVHSSNEMERQLSLPDKVVVFTPEQRQENIKRIQKIIKKGFGDG